MVFVFLRLFQRNQKIIRCFLKSGEFFLQAEDGFIITDSGFADDKITYANMFT